MQRMIMQAMGFLNKIINLFNENNNIEYVKGSKTKEGSSPRACLRLLVVVVQQESRSPPGELL